MIADYKRGPGPRAGNPGRLKSPPCIKLNFFDKAKE